jgi:mRNA interferase MazF
MVAPSAGAVVLVTFPFSDLSQSKLRPAVVLAKAGKSDWILAQITSNAYSDPRGTKLTDDNFSSGSLRTVSYARPAKLFTANNTLIAAQVGRLTSDTLKQIVEAVCELLREGTV